MNVAMFESNNRPGILFAVIARRAWHELVILKRLPIGRKFLDILKRLPIGRTRHTNIQTHP